MGTLKRLQSAFLSAVLLSSLLFSQAPQPQHSPEATELIQQGRELSRKRDYSGAVAAFKKANKLEHNACAQCYLGMANAELLAGHPSDAVTLCDKALSSSPDDMTRAAAHNVKATALYVVPDTKEKGPQIEAEYRAALAADPIPDYRLNLAIAMFREHKDNEAKEELGKILAMQPPPRVAAQAQAIWNDPRRATEEFAPDFQFTTKQGDMVSLKAMAGKIVVLDFWATWCPPCRESVPELRDLTRRYPADKLVLISISADKDASAWQEFVAKKDMTWPQYRDADGDIEHKFGVRAFPTYLVIDQEGIIRQRLVGLDEHQSVVYRLKNFLATVPELSAKKN